MSLQPNEVLIIALVALIVLGPKRLPGAIRGIGRAFRQVREFSTAVRQEMDDTLSPPLIESSSPSGAAEPASRSELAATEPAAVEPAPGEPAEAAPATADARRASLPEPVEDSAADRSPSDGSA